MASIGIDLGTMNSRMGVWRNDRVDIILNDHDNGITPSFAAFTSAGVLVGEAAQHHARKDPHNSVFDIMYLIGREFTDPVVQEGLKRWPFKVSLGMNGMAQIIVQYEGKQMNIKPEDILSTMLAKMRAMASAFIGEGVKKAVMSVPSHFNAIQRHLVKEASKAAGLEVLRIVDEPTLAGVSYALRSDPRARKVFIVDIGGGSTSASLLTVDDTIVEVNATGGEAHLGGNKLDRLMVEHVTREFTSKHQQDITTNARAVLRVLSACEQAKRTLSVSPTARIEIDCLIGDIDFSTTITRAQFEVMCEDHFQKVIEVLEQVVRDAEVANREVDDLVFVGGSSWIPKLRDLVSKFFGGKELTVIDSANVCTVSGAAIHAAILNQIY